MKDRIISFLLWLLVWWIVFYWYTYIKTDDKKPSLNGTWNFNSRQNFDPSNMSDEQLQRMADRSWISLEELKEKIKSWEDIRGIIWWWRNRNWSWTFNQNTRINSSTWASNNTWNTN